jgi:uncharacterized RDD family membrane protein YckC
MNDTLDRPVPAIQDPEIPPPAGLSPSPAPKYAGFWRRAVAFVLDICVVYLLLTIAWTAATPEMEHLVRRGADSPESEAAIREYLFTLLFLLVHWLYYALLESSPWQATPGKRALHLRVTDLEGRRVSFNRASFRAVGKSVSDVTYGIGFLMAGVTRRKQALHDYLAGCLVVRETPAPDPSPEVP